MVPSVFLSFALTDRALVDRFRRAARNAGSSLPFRDHSLQEPVAGVWQTHADRLIRLSTATLCLIGDTTWRSAPVNWELRRSAQLGKRVLAVRLRNGRTRIPAALSEIGVRPMPCDPQALAEVLRDD